MSDSSIPLIKEEEQIKTVLSPDIQFKGKIEFQTSLMIKGNFTGEISSTDGHLTLGKDAVVKANIKSGIITNKGQIIGNIEAYRRMEILKNASLKGDLIAGDIYIESGAFFSGNCSMEEE